MVPTGTTVVVDGNEPANIVMSPADRRLRPCLPPRRLLYPGREGGAAHRRRHVPRHRTPLRVPLDGQPKTAAKILVERLPDLRRTGCRRSERHERPAARPRCTTRRRVRVWDDLVIDGAASVRTGSSGVAPNCTFAVEWHDVRLFGTDLRLTAKVVLAQDGRITMSWSDVDGGTRGSRAARPRSASRTASPACPPEVLERSTDEPSIFNGDATEFLVDRAPTAKAGPDRTVASGKAFILDGSACPDPDGPPGLRFTWSRLSGPVSPITTPGQAKASVAGIKGPAKATYLLKVNDKLGRGSSDTVTVTIKAST